MAHPHNHHRDHKVQHRRVADITAACGGGMARGGAAHSDVAEDKALIHKMVKKKALRASGGAVKARADRPARAWGGRAGKKKMGKSGGKHTVNVIVAPHAPAPGGMMSPTRPPMVPGVAAGPPPGGPPPMPHPMVPPGPGGAPMAGPAGPMVPGAGPMPPGVPPPGMMHRNGGRAYKKGGAVFSGTPEKMAFTTKGKPKASGNDLDSQTAGAGKGRTPIRRDYPSNKDDTPNIGRGAVITKATGGPISSQNAKMSLKLDGGAGGAKARMEKRDRDIKSGYGTPTRTAMNPTQNPKA